MAQLKADQEQSSSVKGESAKSVATKSDVPVFDKSVDYIAKVREQTQMLEMVQALHEDHSVDYINLFKRVVRSQKRL